MWAVMRERSEVKGMPGAAARGGHRWPVVCLSALSVLAVLTVAAATLDVFPTEVSLRQSMLAWTPPDVAPLARAVNYGGSWHVLLPASLIVFAVSPQARRRWWLWSGVLVGSATLETLLKALIARARPEDLSSGFPSGHATAAAAFAVIVVYLASGEGPGRPGPIALQCLVVTGAALVGLARIELRAHWPSDVAAGWALGTAFAAGAAWWDRTSSADRSPAAGRRLEGIALGSGTGSG